MSELIGFAREATAMLEREPDLADFQVYCSSSEQTIVRINYTSAIPCRGVEEAKSESADGVAVWIVLRRNSREHGVGCEALDELSLAAVRRALERARKTAITDPYFTGIPLDTNGLSTAEVRISSRNGFGERPLVASGWRLISGALSTLMQGANPASVDLVLGGDITRSHERVVVVGGKGRAVWADEDTHCSISATALVEKENGKGTAGALCKSSRTLVAKAAQVGSEAMRRALELRAGKVLRQGSYPVVLGPQPVAELLNYIVLPSLTARAHFSNESAFQNRFGEQIIDGRITITDEPLKPRGIIRRRFTCEGMQSQRCELIREGRLASLLATHRDCEQLRASEQLPALAEAVRQGVIEGRHGYRIGDCPVRRFDTSPHATASNVTLSARNGISSEELIRKVGNGIYVGRIWYTYPINGQRAGDFTCTIAGDSRIIENGRLGPPLAPNTLRINASIKDVFENLIAVSRRRTPVSVWGSPTVFYVPELAVKALPMSAVGTGA